MLADTGNLVSFTEANQNFIRVARMVDECSSVVTLRNNVPKYVLIDFAQLQHDDSFSDAEVATLGAQLIAEHQHAFEVLAQ